MIFQLPTDHGGCGVRAVVPPVQEGYPEGFGRDVSWRPTSAEGSVPEELPASVHPEHSSRRRRAT